MRAKISAIPTVWGISGLGCDETDGYSNCYDGLSPSTTGDTGYYNSDGTYVTSVTPINTTNGTTAGSSTNVLSAISALTNSFTSIFKSIQPLPQGCTQVAGPYGMSTQCSASAVANPLSLTSSLSSGGSSTWLLIGGVAVVAFMMFKK